MPWYHGGVRCSTTSRRVPVERAGGARRAARPSRLVLRGAERRTLGRRAGSRPARSEARRRGRAAAGRRAARAIAGGARRPAEPARGGRRRRCRSPSRFEDEVDMDGRRTRPTLVESTTSPQAAPRGALPRRCSLSPAPYCGAVSKKRIPDFHAARSVASATSSSARSKRSPTGRSPARARGARRRSGRAAPRQPSIRCR